MAKRDLPNFTIFGRIAFGAVALLMVLWLLTPSGIVWGSPDRTCDVTDRSRHGRGRD
jgi:hypothetical protein